MILNNACTNCKDKDHLLFVHALKGDVQVKYCIHSMLDLGLCSCGNLGFLKSVDKQVGVLKTRDIIPNLVLDEYKMQAKCPSCDKSVIPSKGGNANEKI